MTYSTTLISTVIIACVMFAGISDAKEPGTWEKTIKEFEKSDVSNPPPDGVVVFVGSSSIRMWKTLEEDMAPIPVVNRGFGGSEIEDSVRHLHRIVTPYKPSAVVLYAGDNDIAGGKSPERVLQDFQEFVEQFRTVSPDVSLFYIAIKPSPRRWSLWPQMHAANTLIHKFAETQKQVYFLDVATTMLDPEGNARSELYLDDMLHMNAAGYRLWTSIVKPALQVDLSGK